MSKISRLNGWQRLWILLSTTYLIGVVSIAVLLFPKKADYLSTRVYDTINLTIKHVPELQGSYAYQIRDDYKDLSDQEVIKRIHAKFKDKIDYSEIERDYGTKLERLPSEKAKAVGIWFLVWLIPSLATYVLGWSVAWVIRGFKKQKVERTET
jgi:hypothetical protein